MSATPGRMMMAWVWVGLMALARLNTVEKPPRDADGGLAELEALFSDSEPPGETQSGGSYFSVPVWKFVKERGNGGEAASDFGEPQYLCSHRAMSVRFSLIRHTNLRLQGGRRLLSFANRCGGSVQTFGPWLLLKLPYNSCRMTLWISDGTWFRQLKLLYFDHQLQANVTGVASCENPATSLQLPAPLVNCGATNVTVKLPLGTRLRMVKALGKDGAAGKASTAVAPRAVFVQMPKLQHMDSLFELIYSDFDGETSTTLAPCLKTVTRSGQHRHPRQVDGEDLWEFWNFEELSVEPYTQQTTPETPTTDATASPTTQDTPTTDCTSPTTPETTTTDCTSSPTTPDTTTTPTIITTDVPFSDAEIFDLWGFDEIPAGPYTGDPTTTMAPPTTPNPSTAAPPSTASSAMTTSDAPTTATTTTTTVAPTTATPTTTTTVAPPTTTTVAPTTATPTTTTTVAPPTTTTAATSTVAPTTATATSAASTTVPVSTT